MIAVASPFHAATFNFLCEGIGGCCPHSQLFSIPIAIDEVSFFPGGLNIRPQDFISKKSLNVFWGSHRSTRRGLGALRERSVGRCGRRRGAMGLATGNASTILWDRLNRPADRHVGGGGADHHGEPRPAAVSSRRGLLSHESHLRREHLCASKTNYGP